MKIKLNHQIINIEESMLLQHLVDQQLGEKQKGIAVAIDEQVIPKSLWPTTELKNNQSVLIIKATQGG